MNKTEWVDFKAIKEAVSMQMVLDHYGVSGLQRVGEDLRGACPIHKGAPSSKHLSVNLTKNAFKCFSSNCGEHGNILDFVAAMEHCSVRDAALKLRDWFKVGDSDDPKNEREKHPSPAVNAIELLNDVIAELEVHTSQIAYHASLAEAKTAAVREIVATLHKEV